MCCKPSYRTSLRNVMQQLGEPPRRPVTVVVIFILGQDSPQMWQVPDEGPIEDFPPAGTDPPLRDRIRPWCPDWNLDHPDTRALKHRIKRGDELDITVTDEELDRLGTPAEINHEIPCLLGNPHRSGISSGPEDVNPPSGVIDDGQAVHLRPVQQVDDEEVSGDDRLGLRSQELFPTRPDPPRCGIDPGLGEDLPYRRGGDPDAKAAGAIQRFWRQTGR